jgi:hypothetical protein
MTYETPPPRDSVPHMPGDPKECREHRGAINFPLDFVTGRAKFETAGPRERDAIQRKPAMLAEGLRDRAVLPETALTHFRTGFPDGAVVELGQLISFYSLALAIVARWGFDGSGSALRALPRLS